MDKEDGIGEEERGSQRKKKKQIEGNKCAAKGREAKQKGKERIGRRSKVGEKKNRKEGKQK